MYIWLGSSPTVFGRFWERQGKYQNTVILLRVSESRATRSHAFLGTKSWFLALFLPSQVSSTLLRLTLSWLDAQTSNFYTLSQTFTSRLGAIFQLSIQCVDLNRARTVVGDSYQCFGVIHVELNQYTEAWIKQ
jgi:hypothetical protein